MDYETARKVADELNSIGATGCSVIVDSDGYVGSELYTQGQQPNLGPNQRLITCPWANRPYTTGAIMQIFNPRIEDDE